MSTPIRQVEVSPEDPKFYAPPRWRRGEVEAPSIQPSLRSAEFLGPQAYADWTSHHGDEGLADERGSAVNNPWLMLCQNLAGAQRGRGTAACAQRRLLLQPALSSGRQSALYWRSAAST
jgi:hypothetical protein